MRAVESVTIELSAVVIAVTAGEPRVLVLQEQEHEPGRLPSGPFALAHRTLEQGLRAWVAEQTHQTLGYVEQLYTFADRDRSPDTASPQVVSVGYLALVHEAEPWGFGLAVWRNWYRYFPWEDWREGRPTVIDDIIAPAVSEWAASAATPILRRERQDRVRLAFGLNLGGCAPPWNEERVLERFELLYEAGLVAEAARPPTPVQPTGSGGAGALAAAPTLAVAVPLGEAMALDHRRILATALARLRGKIKYRPVVFEVLAPSFTFLQLQQVVEALTGMRLHKQNFRRLVEQCGLVEETGAHAAQALGRPARLLRFRREVILERLATGVRVPAHRGG